MKALKLPILIAVITLVQAASAHTPSHEIPAGRPVDLKEDLAERGFEFNYGITGIYQQNTRGGLSTHRKAGRFAGSYDIELTTDMEKLFNIENAFVYMHAEGSWSGAGGIDPVSVGSYFGVNGDGAPRRSLDLTELWYEQTFWDVLKLRFGKLDITGGFECRGCPVSFDGNAFANDETSQFLNAALVNNPTIPFPDKGLGAVLFYNPIESWYASVGIVDAQADARETGFNSAFHDEDYFLYVIETGVTPHIHSANGKLQGAYRIGFWIDGQDKQNFSTGRNYRDDAGFYLSCDQVLTKENDDPDDSQGLGAFFRYGHADSDRNDLNQFWSVGCQYQGLFDGRDDDVLGIGIANGIFSDQTNANDGNGFTDDSETVIELYYNASITPSLDLSPSLQYISNPAGDKSATNAIVIGLRAQMTF